MKVTEAKDEQEDVLYYYINTDKGSPIGTTFPNKTPIDGDEEITLKDAKKTATLWSSASDLLEVLLEVNNRYASLMTEKMRNKMNSAIEKARGL